MKRQMLSKLEKYCRNSRNTVELSLSTSSSSSSSVPEPVGDGQQLVGLLHGLDLGVRLLVHGLVAAAGVVQQLLP